MRYAKRYEVTRQVAEDTAMHVGLIEMVEREARAAGYEPSAPGTIQFRDPSDPNQVNWIEPDTPPNMVVVFVEVPVRHT